MKKLLTFILLCFSLLSLSYAGSITDGNRLYYTLDSVLTESVGTGYTLTNYNTTLATSSNCAIMSCYKFNGINQKLSRANELPNWNTTGFTMNMWLMETETVSEGVFFTTYDYGTTQFIDLRLRSGIPNVYIYTSTTQYAVTLTGINMSKSKFMLTVVWKNNNLSMYINRTYRKSVATTGTIGTASLGNGYSLGGRTGAFFHGNIDEYSYWSREIPQNNITSLFNSGAGLQYPYINSVVITNVKTQKGTLTDNNYFNTTTINFNVTTNQHTNKKYFLRYFSNNTLISSSALTPSNSLSSFINITLTDNKYKIMFNATNINGTSRTNNYTFTIDTTLPSITNNMPIGDWYNYTLKPLKTRFVTCTDTNLLWCNISTDTFNKNVTTTNNITYITNGNKTYTLRAVDIAGNSISTTGSFRVNPYQYFRFYDSLRSIYTSSFIVTNNSDIYSSVGNYVKIPIFDLGYGTHQLYYNKTGYQTKLFSTTFNTTSKLNTTINVNPIRILLKVYSETSPTTQLKFNMTIQNSTTSTQYLNQMNFSKYYNETLHGDLTLTVSNIGYGARKLYVTLLPNTVSNNTMYLLRAGASNYPIIFRALQGSGGSASTIPLEDVILSFYRTISGTRTFLGQAQTDNNGYTYFNMNYTLGDYEVIFQKTGFITETLLTLPNVQEYTIYMVIEAAEVVNNLEDFDYAFYPSGNFVINPFIGGVTLTASNNDLSSWRFKVTGNSSINYLSTASNGGSVYYNITNKSPTYTFNLTIVKNGVTYSFIKVYNNNNLSYTNSTNLIVVAQNLNSGDYNGEKIMIILFVYIIFVGLGIFLSAGNQAVGLVTGILPLTMFMVVDLVTIPLYSILMLVTILGAYATRGGN